jgi:hypothetical protein
MQRVVVPVLFALGILMTSGITIADDDFSSDLIDGSKWRYQEYASYVDDEKGVLRIITRSDSQEENVPIAFRFSNPESITGVRTEVVLHACSVSQNDADALAKARLYGVFYNTQAAPSGFGGDVWAELYIEDRGDGLEAGWYVGEVADDEGSSSHDLGEEILVAPGSLTLDATYVLEMMYDEVGRQLHFAIQDSTGAQIANGTYMVNNRQSPAQEPDWLLWAAADDDSAYVDAEFDNVSIKMAASNDFSLYDTFNRFDAKKWSSNQIYRRIEDGKLIAMVQSLEKSEYIQSVFQDNPDFVQAEVTVSSNSEVLPGDHGAARIQGFFYNDRVPAIQQTSYRGNIFATTAIEDRAGDLSARCYLLRVLDDNGNREETVWEQSFDDFTIQYDTAYTLSLEYTHTALIFTLSDGVTIQSHTYTIQDTSSIYPPNAEFRGLNTFVCRCGNTPGSVMKADFDNVVTTTPTDNNNHNNDSSSGGGGGGGGCFLQTTSP